MRVGDGNRRSSTARFTPLKDCALREIAVSSVFSTSARSLSRSGISRSTNLLRSSMGLPVKTLSNGLGASVRTGPAGKGTGVGAGVKDAFGDGAGNVAVPFVESGVPIPTGRAGEAGFGAGG